MDYGEGTGKKGVIKKPAGPGKKYSANDAAEQEYRPQPADRLSARHCYPGAGGQQRPAP